MKIIRLDEHTIEVRFGQGFPAHEHHAEFAMLDIDTEGVPVQVELVRIFTWLRMRGVNVSPPGIGDLGDDAAAISYDPDADCMMVRMLPDRVKRTPFHCHQVPLLVLADFGGRLCGVRLTLDSREADAISARARNALDE